MEPLRAAQRCTGSRGRAGRKTPSLPALSSTSATMASSRLAADRTREDQLEQRIAVGKVVRRGKLEHDVRLDELARVAGDRLVEAVREVGAAAAPRKLDAIGLAYEVRARARGLAREQGLRVAVDLRKEDLCSREGVPPISTTISPGRRSNSRRTRMTGGSSAPLPPLL